MVSDFPAYLPDRAQPLFGLSIALAILSTLTLCGRFWSRGLLKDDRFKADDWTALAAWPLVAGTAACGALAMRHGFGTHFAEIVESSPQSVPGILIITYVGELTWTFGIGIIRSSALLFYDRVFGRAGIGFRRFVIAGVIFNILFSTILGFVCIFQCTPVSGYWNKSIESTCLSTLDIELGSGISSIILDLYTLLLPMPVIWRLQLSATKKALTTLTFVLGYCVIILTIGRTVTVAKTGQLINEDLTWYFPNVLYWVITELAIAHICISLPSLFALYRRAKRYGVSSLFTTGHVQTLVNAENSQSVKQSETHRASRSKGSFGSHFKLRSLPEARSNIERLDSEDGRPIRHEV